MAHLTEQMRVYVVTQLASFRTPSEVVADVKGQFGVEVSRQQVERYNPTRVAGADVAKKWRTLFARTREAYLADVLRHGVAHRAYRLEVLQRLLDKNGGRNPRLVLEILEQAAAETIDAEIEERLRRLEGRE